MKIEGAVHALVEQIEDVYPGDQATYIVAQLLSEPKAVDKQLAGLLPEMYPFV